MKTLLTLRTMAASALAVCLVFTGANLAAGADNSVSPNIEPQVRDDQSGWRVYAERLDNRKIEIFADQAPWKIVLRWKVKGKKKTFKRTVKSSDSRAATDIHSRTKSAWIRGKDRTGWVSGWAKIGIPLMSEAGTGLRWILGEGFERDFVEDEYHWDESMDVLIRYPGSTMPYSVWNKKFQRPAQGSSGGFGLCDQGERAEVIFGPDWLVGQKVECMWFNDPVLCDHHTGPYVCSWRLHQWWEPRGY